MKVNSLESRKAIKKNRPIAGCLCGSTERVQLCRPGMMIITGCLLQSTKWPALVNDRVLMEIQ